MKLVNQIDLNIRIQHRKLDRDGTLHTADAHTVQLRTSTKYNDTNVIHVR